MDSVMDAVTVTAMDGVMVTDGKDMATAMGGEAMATDIMAVMAVQAMVDIILGRVVKGLLHGQPELRFITV